MQSTLMTTTTNLDRRDYKSWRKLRTPFPRGAWREAMRKGAEEQQQQRGQTSRPVLLRPVVVSTVASLAFLPAVDDASPCCL